MRAWLSLLAPIVALTLCSDRVEATITVNPAMPIDREVVVQLIQAFESNGTNPATVLGNAAQRLSIELALDQIWAQAGINVTLLATVTPYNSSFALDANDSGGTRPFGDLNTIFVQASSAGVLNTGNVINTIFVNHVPGFPVLGENSAAGLAAVSGNRIAMYTGDNLLGFQNGLDIIASVFAHEIGHNLGLNHTADGIANLMSPNGSSQQLDASQIAAARSSGLLLIVPEQNAAILLSLAIGMFAARRRR
jgi:Metallo-peptidase family M12B Reprolysin-like